ncbi:RING-H2 group F2A [Actinidia rufa]|uniref:RING-type E3 ubiquitin transferase n=1 Tax=Actinidia rufa TaxID=165716 RepID=A0A7J0FH48_9ERIC|nr:RING-H2 group F2A [Actinidia rufa]
MTSAAAFVEGGIQDACDDACSICLEAFCESDPSTVTSCRHEFHLQCILEWETKDYRSIFVLVRPNLRNRYNLLKPLKTMVELAWCANAVHLGYSKLSLVCRYSHSIVQSFRSQRSSNCPMCWQSISLKDPSSQELLEAVERERSIRFNPSRNATIFHHPTLGDFELQHLPVGANDTELEERIIQHLAAAAAMGRAHHIARREGPRSRSSVHGRPQFVVFSTHPNAPPAGHVSASLNPVAGESEPAAITVASPSPLAGGDEPQQHRPQFPSVQIDQISASSSGSTILPAKRQGIFVNNRYKESISKSTRGWKERMFSRSTSVADLGSEVGRETNAGRTTVSRMMESLETRDNNSADSASDVHNLADTSVTGQHNQNNVENHHELLSDSCTAARAASSVSN